MINENVNLKDFFRELPARGDGLIYIFAAIVCLILLIANLGVHFHIVELNSFGTEKWIAVWCFMPLLLFFAHIRLRQLIETESRFAVLLHGLVQFGIVTLLIFKNGGFV